MWNVLLRRIKAAVLPTAAVLSDVNPAPIPSAPVASTLAWPADESSDLQVKGKFACMVDAPPAHPAPALELPQRKAPEPATNLALGKSFCSQVEQLTLEEDKLAKAEWQVILDICSVPADEENYHLCKVCDTMANIYTALLENWAPELNKSNHWMAIMVNKYAEPVLVARDKHPASVVPLDSGYV
ncbi:hypothetical protein FRC12_010185 [Ceratobasidium sp. 428]|nr:hypothetical protein FRC12_010185 [Ceratobasidium sp. 428]